MSQPESGGFPGRTVVRVLGLVSKAGGVLAREDVTGAGRRRMPVEKKGQRRAEGGDALNSKRKKSPVY
jgi:hypothetical protein